MLGVRLAPLLFRTIQIRAPILTNIPKAQYSQAYIETTSLYLKTSVLPSNIVIRNLLQMLEKIGEQAQQQKTCEISSLAMICNSILKITHLKTRQGSQIKMNLSQSSDY